MQILILILNYEDIIILGGKKENSVKCLDV
jgi:hypothetical protein